jgi:hypothetical protein
VERQSFAALSHCERRSLRCLASIRSIACPRPRAGSRSSAGRWCGIGTVGIPEHCFRRARLCNNSLQLLANLAPTGSVKLRMGGVFDDRHSFITRDAFLRAQFDLDYRTDTAERDAELLQWLRDRDGRHALVKLRSRVLHTNFLCRYLGLRRSRSVNLGGAITSGAGNAANLSLSGLTWTGPRSTPRRRPFPRSSSRLRAEAPPRRRHSFELMLSELRLPGIKSMLATIAV